MSKIGNHVVGMTETDDYWFGWESAERGEPEPIWRAETHCQQERLDAQQFGWQQYHALIEACEP